ECDLRDSDLEPAVGTRPRYPRNLRPRYEATTLVPRAKQAPRRTPVRWYPTHGSRHDQPSLLQAPSLPLARALVNQTHSEPSRHEHARSLGHRVYLTVEV